MVSGILVGYLMIDIKVILFDGLYYDVDLFELVYKIVVLKVLIKVKDLVGIVLLEFIMDVLVIIFDDYYGDVMGDIICCRG